MTYLAENKVSKNPPQDLPALIASSDKAKTSSATAEISHRPNKF